MKAFIHKNKKINKKISKKKKKRKANSSPTNLKFVNDNQSFRTFTTFYGTTKPKFDFQLE